MKKNILTVLILLLSSFLFGQKFEKKIRIKAENKLIKRIKNKNTTQNSDLLKETKKVKL